MLVTGRSPWIQVAGVHDADEAVLLAACGVTHVGIPLRLAVHAEDIDDREAAAIVRSLAGVAVPVLVTYLDRAAEVEDLCRRLGVSTVQIHGDIEAGELMRLRESALQLTVVKSLVVRPGALEALETVARATAPFVDAFITDTWDPVTGATGATGRVHDWSISRALVARAARPVILAGGLTPDNVGAAIRSVRPAGVDAHTGLEDASGRKSRSLVERFVAEARAAFAETATDPSPRV